MQGAKDLLKKAGNESTDLRTRIEALHEVSESLEAEERKYEVGITTPLKIPPVCSSLQQILGRTALHLFCFLQAGVGMLMLLFLLCAGGDWGCDGQHAFSAAHWSTSVCSQG